MPDRRRRLNASHPRIRPYRPEDREAVRHICCETGCGGRPVDLMYSDRQLFADFLTRYYTDFEPESSLVVEDGGRVVGYLTGCRRHRYHRVVQFLIGVVVGTRALLRTALGRYERASRAYVRWCFFRAQWEIPSIPPRAGHFHVNLLPGYRQRGLGLRLYRRFMASLDGRVGSLFVRVETTDDRRSGRIFERFGFRQVHRRRISRFTGSDGPVYVSAFARDLPASGGERRR